MSTFRTSGEQGDCLYMLPILRALGGKHSIYLVDRVLVPPFSRPITPLRGFMEEFITSQSYIKELICTEDEPDFDMSKFRSFHEQSKTLVNAQVAYFNSISEIKVDEDGSEPWLNVGGRTPSKRIVIARSSRYNNSEFPWKEIVTHYGERIQFIGLPHEHKAFVKSFGAVEHAKVKTLLEMAKLINNADLFIGNQSAPLAVAIGLGGPVIEEVFIHQPDCIFPRKGIQYCYDGSCILPDFSGSGRLAIESKMKVNLDVSTNIVPPGLWQYPGAQSSGHIGEVIKIAAQLDSVNLKEARDRVLSYNINRCPSFYSGSFSNGHQAVELAFESAKMAHF